MACESQGDARHGQVPRHEQPHSWCCFEAVTRHSWAAPELPAPVYTYLTAAAAQDDCDWKLLRPEFLHLQAPTHLLLVLLEASKRQTGPA